MPSGRTDTLHARRICAGGGSTMHYDIPFVEIAVNRHIGVFSGRHLTGGHLRAVRIMCGAQVLLHPALLTDLHGMINIAIVVSEGGHARTRLTVASRGKRREGHFVAICRAFAVDGIGTHIVSRTGIQACNGSCEAAHARAANDMVACNGRVVGGAPADTALGHRGVAIVGDIAAHRGRFGRDVADCQGGDRRNTENGFNGRCFRRESHLVAVNGTQTVDGISTYIVSRTGGETCQR